MLLGIEPPEGQKADPQLKDITIKHLIEHTGGWDNGKERDPMFQPVTIANLQAHDVNVRLLGDVAIIHASTTYTVDGRNASGRYTDVWALREGKWLAVSAHVTRA